VTAQARAALFHGSGRGFEIVDVPIPPLGPGEMLVEIEACTLCGSDLHSATGRRDVPTPIVLGHEAVGRVVATGGDTQVQVGQRIIWSIVVACGSCFFCKHGLPQKCATRIKFGHEQFTDEQPLFGGLASHAVLPTGAVIAPIPDDLDAAVACPISCATATIAAVLRTVEPIDGACVVILGAGALGLIGSAWASHRGADVVVVEPKVERAARAQRFGAGTVEPTSAAARISELTDGRGADAVLELAGTAPAVELALDLVRIGGSVTLAGTVTPTPSIEFYPEQVVQRMIRIVGVHNYAPGDLLAAVEFTAAARARIPFEALVGQRFVLDDVAAAFEAAETGSAARVLVSQY